MSIEIIVLQRSWIVVGEVTRQWPYITINNAAVIRTWGTRHGLGEIAYNGPTEETVLDAQPKTVVHELTVIQAIECESIAKWKAALTAARDQIRG